MELYLRTTLFSTSSHESQTFYGGRISLPDYNAPAFSSEKRMNLITFIFILISFHTAHFITPPKKRESKGLPGEASSCLLSLPF